MLDLTNIQGVIFDLDGTLVESSLDFTKMRNDIGCPKDEDILVYIDSLPEAKRERSEAIVLQHEMLDATHAAILPIGKIMLEQVAAARLPMAIVTRNCRAATEQKLRNNQIHIPIVITREDAPPKPAPTALLQIASLWDLPPKELLYVGDYIYDRQAAENAGMRWFLIE